MQKCTYTSQDPWAWLRETSSDGEGLPENPEQSNLAGSTGVLQQPGPGFQMGSTRDMNGFKSGRAFAPTVGLQE